MAPQGLLSHADAVQQGIRRTPARRPAKERREPMRLTTRTDLALRTLMFCALNPDRIVRKHEVAERCNVSENHLAQVINGLAHKGFVTTLRGRNGGLTLARPMDKIGVGSVARAFEGGVPVADCFATSRAACPLSPACRLRDALARAVAAFYDTLDQLTIADLVNDNEGLMSVLTMPGPIGMRCARTAAAAE